MNDGPRLAVVDPGVMISGFISTGGTTADLLERLLRGHFVAVISPRLLDELHTVLYRDKFRRYVTRQQVDAFVVGWSHEASSSTTRRRSRRSVETPTRTTSSPWPERRKTSISSSPATKTCSPSAFPTWMCSPPECSSTRYPERNEPLRTRHPRKTDWRDTPSGTPQDHDTPDKSPPPSEGFSTTATQNTPRALPDTAWLAGSTHGGSRLPGAADQMVARAR